MLKKFFVLVLALITTISVPSTQSKAYGQVGSGRLNIAISDGQITLSLSTTGSEIMDQLGVEQDSQTRVAIAVSRLSDPLELFRMADSARCFATSANVTLPGKRFGVISDKGGERDQVKNSEFHADYEIRCQNMDALREIEFRYFDRFPSAKTLAVKITEAEGISTQQVTRTTPVLSVAPAR
ncbi:DUF2796 domain-containing protein [Ruegeria sp. HKCCA5426]|uniref:ZrgA family zinc uptake protein n=1 Tax=Ruegeria sp. HKCCA5426 TaxID=2682985 RepID=UPI001488B17C